MRHRTKFRGDTLGLASNTTYCPIRRTRVMYTVSTKKRPPKHAYKFSKLASFAQFQSDRMNICLFSIKVPILVKICHTVIEILTFNKWSQKFTVSRSVFSYLQSMELTDISIDVIVALAKQKQTKWCLVPKILF